MKRERLLELTRGDDSESFDRAIDVQIHRLRRLIESDPAQPRFLQTVWGLGYVFVPDGAEKPGASGSSGVAWKSQRPYKVVSASMAEIVPP